MRRSRCENYQLKEEYSRLQESYRALEQLKTKLQSSESTWQINVTDAQKQAELTHDEVSIYRFFGMMSVVDSESCARC